MIKRERKKDGEEERETKASVAIFIYLLQPKMFIAQVSRAFQALSGKS